jgi:hypothetical protein
MERRVDLLMRADSENDGPKPTRRKGTLFAADLETLSKKIKLQKVDTVEDVSSKIDDFMVDSGVRKCWVDKRENSTKNPQFSNWEYLDERSEDLDDDAYLERERKRFKFQASENKPKPVFFNGNENTDDLEFFENKNKAEGLKEFIKCGSVLSKIHTCNFYFFCGEFMVF